MSDYNVSSDGINFPSRTSDPSTLVEGLMWHRSDLNKFHAYLNGTILSVGPQVVKCCNFGAKSDGVGKFLIANGTSDKADDSSKDKTRFPIAYTGIINKISYKTKEADTTTQMKIHINGTVQSTILLTNINANKGGVESLSISVNEGDYAEIEYDAGQKSGECIMELFMDIS